VWRVFAAPTPVHLRCAHCGATLRVRNGTLPLFLFALLLGGLLGMAVLWLRDEVSPLVALLVAGVAIAVAEAGIGLWIVHRGKLETHGR
jgi:hypothetical protein